MTTSSLTIAPFARPLYVMLKPAGASCNLHCDYCYYLEKKELYQKETEHVLTEELLDLFVRQYFEGQTMSAALFTWHGGEPLLRGLDFYKKALLQQQKYAGGRRVDNTIQTNGVLLTDDWCRFFKDNNFLVGISIDGPEHCHNRYRKTNRGEGAFPLVMKGLERLKKFGVEFNVMATVNDQNVNFPSEVYRFFKAEDCRFIQFSPVTEMLPGGAPAPWNVSPDKWGDFLITVFDEWVANDVGKYFVQHFDATLANWVGEQPGICILSETCGHAGVMEFNGDVYSCDHFVFPDRKLGNIRTTSLTGMMYSDRQFEFGADKRAGLTSRCRNCNYLFACNGECPKNRIVKIESEEYAHNYLCEGYYRYFDHAAPYMEFMKNELLNRRSPANITDVLKRRVDRDRYSL